MGWQRHQPDHMQVICTSLQTDSHASTSSLKFLRTGCPSCRPTNSVKALKVLTRDRKHFDKRPHRPVEYIDRAHARGYAHVCPPPKIVHSMGDPGPYLTLYGYLRPAEPTRQTASRSVQPFSQHTPMSRTYTHGQTDLATRSVAIGRIYAIYAGLINKR